MGRLSDGTRATLTCAIEASVNAANSNLYQNRMRVVCGCIINAVAPNVVPCMWGSIELVCGGRFGCSYLKGVASQLNGVSARHLNWSIFLRWQKTLLDTPYSIGCINATVPYAYTLEGCDYIHRTL